MTVIVVREDCHPKKVPLLTIAKPVTGGSDRGLLRTSTERKGLSYDDPSHGTPGTGERRNKHARADNENDTDSAVVNRVNSCTDRGKDAQPSSLPDGSDEQRPTTSKSLDEPETRESSGNVDSTQDELGLNGVLDSSRLEDGSSIVEEVVDAGPLLKKVDEESEQRTPDKLRN